MPNPSISFEECNQRLIHGQIMVDVQEYITYTYNISSNMPSTKNSDNLIELIRFMIQIEQFAPDEFAIQLEQIEKFGLVIKNTLRNKWRLLTNRSIDHLSNELSFVRTNKLVQGVDFELICRRSNDHKLNTGYHITIMAFHKLIHANYDKQFLITMNARILQIVFNYQQYLKNFYDDRIKSLQTTIHGLTEDLAKIAVAQSDLTKSVIMNDTVPESYEYCNCLRDSYISDDGIYERIFEDEMIDNRYTIRSLSPVDTILELPSRTSELDNIHEKLLYLINSPNSSVSNLYNDIDSILSYNSDRSSFETDIRGNHINLLQRRFSTCLHAESNKKINGALRCSIA